MSDEPSDCPPISRLTCGSEFRHLSRELADLKGDLKDIKSSLIGNGKPGLLTRVTLLEDGHIRNHRALGLIAGFALTILASGLIWFIAHGVHLFAGGTRP